jgi:hypothetical protein
MAGKPIPSNVAAAFYQSGYPQLRSLPMVSSPPPPFPPYPLWRKPGMYTDLQTPNRPRPQSLSVFQPLSSG